MNAARTRIASRIVGPYLVVIGATLLSRVDAFGRMLPAFLQDIPLVVATGVFTLLAGLTLFAFHHHWSSPPAMVVSGIAAAASIKGASLVLFPQAGAPILAVMARMPPLLMVAGILVLGIGGWLSFLGWTAKETS